MIVKFLILFKVSKDFLIEYFNIYLIWAIFRKVPNYLLKPLDRALKITYVYIKKQKSHFLFDFSFTVSLTHIIPYSETVHILN